jgi:thiol-disulfide isomerase/thioredoxin
MKFKRFLWLACLIAWFAPVYADADSTRIEVSIPQLKNKQIYFCSHFNGAVYKQDSLLLSSQGTGVFHNSETFPEGLYFIAFDHHGAADLLLADEQSLSVAITDTADIIRNMRISGGEQPEVYLSILQFFQTKSEERNQIVQTFNALPAIKKEESKDSFQKQIEAINKEVALFQQNIIEKYRDKWLGLFFKGIQPVLTGPYPAPRTQAEYNEEFRYQKEHYFDNIKLTDKRFWWTNFLPQKVTEYMQKQVEQHPDSLAHAASRLVSKTLGDSVSFKLMMNRLLEYASTNDILGMENIWAKLVEDYYHKGLVTWGDTIHLTNIEYEYAKIRFNRVGMYAFDLGLINEKGKEVDIFNLAKNYTLLYFYEPSCSHCIQTTPELYEQIYKKYADKGLDIVAVCLVDREDKQQWDSFVRKYKLSGNHWHNVWDPDKTSNYRKYYDTSTTPAIYILDKDKKIIAKSIDIPTMKLILDAFLK